MRPVMDKEQSLVVFMPKNKGYRTGPKIIKDIYRTYIVFLLSILRASQIT